MRIVIQAFSLLLCFGLAQATVADDSAATGQASSQPADSEAEPQQVINPEAEKAVKAWLALVDEGKIQESLEASSGYFQQRVDTENWQQAMELNRAPLGEVIFRNPSSSRADSNIPGGPEGQYMIYQFSSKFVNKIEAQETVTMVQEDGNWRVIGYFIE